MAKEDNIVIPRWFLEVVEDTLRIQNNINLDKKTGETCQDRNVRQALNGVRKLLNGEELTGMERLERLHPSVPSNIDEAAKEYNRNLIPFDQCDSRDIRKAFKAGAEWMAKQGETEVDLKAVVRIDNIVMALLSEGYNDGYKTRPFYEEVLRRFNENKEK